MNFHLKALLEMTNPITLSLVETSKQREAIVKKLLANKNVCHLWFDR